MHYVVSEICRTCIPVHLVISRRRESRRRRVETLGWAHAEWLRPPTRRFYNPCLCVCVCVSLEETRMRKGDTQALLKIIEEDESAVGYTLACDVKAVRNVLPIAPTILFPDNVLSQENFWESNSRILSYQTNTYTHMHTYTQSPPRGIFKSEDWSDECFLREKTKSWRKLIHEFCNARWMYENILGTWIIFS